MKYINAKTVLPPWLVRELQRYLQGGYLYIPADQSRPKRWGEVSGYRQELQQRNRQIQQAADAEEKSETELFSQLYELQNNQPLDEEQKQFLEAVIRQVKGEE